MRKQTDRPIASLRPLLTELGLISEEDYARITGTTESTRETWRKKGRGFPAIRLGNEYYYPISQARAHVEKLLKEKQPDDFDDFL